MIEKADKVVMLSETSDDAIRKLDERNHRMVDHADILICVTPYDNILTRPGGTGNCLRYAAGKGKTYTICKLQM